MYLWSEEKNEQVTLLTNPFTVWSFTCKKPCQAYKLRKTTFFFFFPLIIYAYDFQWELGEKDHQFG